EARAVEVTQAVAERFSGGRARTADGRQVLGAKTAGRRADAPDRRDRFHAMDDREDQRGDRLGPPADADAGPAAGMAMLRASGDPAAPVDFGHGDAQGGELRSKIRR